MAQFFAQLHVTQGRMILSLCPSLAEGIEVEWNDITNLACRRKLGCSVSIPMCTKSSKDSSSSALMSRGLLAKLKHKKVSIEDLEAGRGDPKGI